MDDIQLLKLEEKLKEAQELIQTLYHDMGSSANLDHNLWWKTRTYCEKHGILTKKLGGNKNDRI